MEKSKELCMNCAFCVSGKCLVLKAGKPVPQKQVKEYLACTAAECPCHRKIRYA